MIAWSLWLLASLAIPVVPCGADPHESNDSRSKARRLKGAIEAATCADDEDWYKINLEARKTVEIVIDHHPSAKLATPRLYRPHGRKPVGRVTRKPGRTTVLLRTRRAGNHRLRIAGADKTRTVYSLSVSTR